MNANFIKQQTRSILNNLTPQNFQELSKEMASMDIDSDDLVIEVVDIIFEKTCLEPHLAEASANMCRTVLTIRGADDDLWWRSEDPMVKNFRRYLLTRCQNEFQKEKDYDKEFEVKLEVINSSEDAENVKKEKREVLELEHQKQRKKYLGNICFIGELFKQNFLTEKIMHSCIKDLLKRKGEDPLECLCKLLTIVGRKMDHYAGKKLMDQYFKRIKQMIAAKETSSRIRSMLSDIVELREDAWGTKKICRGLHDWRTVSSSWPSKDIETDFSEMSVKTGRRGGDFKLGGRCQSRWTKGGTGVGTSGLNRSQQSSQTFSQDSDGLKSRYVYPTINYFEDAA